MKPKLVLYSTEGCHLCDVAKVRLQPFRQQIDYRVIDIVSDDDLVAQFATSIPVLGDLTTHRLLFWPFECKDIEEFIR